MKYYKEPTVAKIIESIVIMVVKLAISNLSS